MKKFVFLVFGILFTLVEKSYFNTQVSIDISINKFSQRSSDVNYSYNYIDSKKLHTLWFANK